MAWNLKGAASEPLDASSRTLGSLAISACDVHFQSLAEDTLTWTAATETATGTGTIVPRIGQVVELWRHSVRVFRGHAVAPMVGMRQISITVQGPWWWLDRISLTSDQTDATGTTAERPTYVFATGSLKTAIETLIDRAITNGAPIRRGTVATMFDVPRMTLAEQSCAAALATLMQWCPDAVAWFDYSDTSGSGLPVLHIGRRGGFAATTLTIGTDAVEIAEITPRLDLEVSRAELAYVTRQVSTGKPAWASQASGTAATGKRQIITISGPEISDYLPREDFASQTIRTVPADVFAFSTVYAHDAALKQAADTYGTYAMIWDGAFQRAYGQRPQAQVPYTGTWYRVVEGEIPAWADELPGFQRKTVQVRGWIYHSYNNSLGYGNAVKSLIEQQRAVGGYNAPYYQWLFYADFSIEIINQHWPTLTTLYRPWDFDFLTPPAGLAAALLAAQNWIPWEGNITTVGDDVSGANLLGGKYNLAGTLTECATMAAIARGVSHDIMRSRTTIELGAPARTDYGTMVSRIRRDPQDNLVYL